MKRNRQAALSGLLAVLALAACEAGEDVERSAPTEDVRAAELEAGAAELAPIDHSGVTGTVRAERDGEDVTVTVTLDGLQPNVAYTANLNDGRCASGGPVRLPLGAVEIEEGGRGFARLRTRGAQLPPDEPAFVQVQGSGGRAVACADLSEPPAGPSLLGEAERPADTTTDAGADATADAPADTTPTG